MIKLILFFIFISGCYRDTGKSGGDREGNPHIKHHIEENFKIMMDAAFNKDTAKYFSFIDMNTYVGLDDHGEIIDSGLQLERAFRHNTELIRRYNSFDFQRIVIKVISPDCVLVIAKVKADIEVVNSQALSFSGGYSQIWHKVGSHWKVISSSSMLSPQSDSHASLKK